MEQNKARKLYKIIGEIRIEKKKRKRDEKESEKNKIIRIKDELQEA